MRQMSGYAANASSTGPGGLTRCHRPFCKTPPSGTTPGSGTTSSPACQLPPEQVPPLHAPLGRTGGDGAVFVGRGGGKGVGWGVRGKDADSV